MLNLSVIGRVFFGIAIGGLGYLSVYNHDFPYMLIPPGHSWIPGLQAIVYIFGALLILAGACIIIGKKVTLVSLVIGWVFLLIFCFYFIPYQCIVSKNNLHFGDWENAAKELALAGGALVIAGSFPQNNENLIGSFWSKLIPFGAILYAITILSFGIDHFLYAKEAADYVPSWIPNHVFWIYFCGIPLTASGIAIILRFKVSLIAALLGSMIFIWFIILHVPYVIAASSSRERAGEAASALLALAYSGVAFVIAGDARKKNSTKSFS
jgi:hypothetical protein